MSKNIFLTIGAFIFVITFLGAMWWHGRQEAQGKVVVLCGPSASGKTSLQKALQQRMLPNLVIKLGIDSLFDGTLPDITAENMALWQSKNDIRWIESDKDHDGRNQVHLFVGSKGDAVIYGMNKAVAAYARSGCDVIVDYIPYKKTWVDDLQKQLKGFQVYWVKISTPLAVIEKREKSRGTSPVGHARSHYAMTEQLPLPWALEIDTSVCSPEEGAKMLAEQFLG